MQTSRAKANKLQRMAHPGAVTEAIPLSNGYKEQDIFLSTAFEHDHDQVNYVHSLFEWSRNDSNCYHQSQQNQNKLCV